jgi:hypothetical protein
MEKYAKEALLIESVRNRMVVSNVEQERRC